MLHVAVYVGQAIVAALEAVDQLFVIEPQLVQQRGVQIMHMHGAVGHVVAQARRSLPCTYPARNPPPATHIVKALM